MSTPHVTAGLAPSDERAGSGVAGLARAPHVAALLFGSGLSALVYQIAWQREFRLIFGSSTASSAAVLSIFIGGMGAGGLLLGARSDRAPRPLRFYAGLELVIAAFAALTPPLLDLVRAVYVRLGGTLSLGVGVGTMLRLILAAVVLAVPTLLMGGTLPAAARSVQSSTDARRRTVGFLYASNTLGAVAGALVATFWMLEAFGTRASLWVACAANAGVALLARRLDQTLGTGPADVSPAHSNAGDAEDTSKPAISPWFVLLSAALSGFAFFLMELVWYRMLAPLLGGSVYTFGLILAVALLGIGLGGFLYSLFGKNTPATLAGFAITCVLEAFCVALPFALGDRVALLALATYPGGGSRLLAFLPGWLAVTAVVVLPAALVAGIQYPLFIALLGAGRTRIGRHLGAAAACNTAGAMLGSLAGGFFLLPMLFATGSWRMVALLLSALGLVALFFALRLEGNRPKLLSVPLLFGATLLCLASRGPTAAWRHTPIGAGRVDQLYLDAPNTFRGWLNDARRSIVWETEGRESSVALDSTDGLAMVVNGKIDGNSRGDAATQVMGGMLGALLHPHPRSAMVIGLGTGSSAGWLGVVPSIERVDVAELESSMQEVARRCATVNADVLSNSKVRILIGDARETLLTIPARYDVIFSEPSNPYRAGIASLFTREYYRAVQSRLEEGGVFLQWVQMYEVDADTVRVIYATLGSVFAEVETWYLGSADLVLIGSDRPLSHDARALRARASEEPYRRALSVAWRTEGLEGVLAHYVATPAFAREIANRPGQVINTDDRNRVEFGFARGVGNFDRVDGLFEPLRKRKENRPVLLNDDVDWPRVAEERLMQIAGEGTEPGIPEGLSVPEELRASAAVNYVSGNIEGALDKWKFQDREPIGPTELGLVAEGLAQAGNKDALPVIERLAAFQPVEADVVRARLFLRQGNREEAIRLLGQALIRFRSDPWPSSMIMGRALELAKEIATGGEEPAARMMELLNEPFAVRSIDTQRRHAALAIAQNLPHSNHCLLAWKEFEPHPPWDVDSLTSRRDCYQKWNHSRVEQAQRDLDQYTRCALSFGWLRCL